MDNYDMHKIINILSVLNTDGIMVQEDSDAISQNIFMIADSNYFRQLSNTVYVYCKAGDKLRFRFSGIKSDIDVELKRIMSISRRKGVLTNIHYNSDNDCWEAEVKCNGKGIYIFKLLINGKLFRWKLPVYVSQPLCIIGVIDCANAAKDYENFGYYVYLLDSRNDQGIGKSIIPGSIEQMTVKCRHGDILYFSLRGILPSDMPIIKKLKCHACRIIARPIKHPAGAWVAFVAGDSDGSLEYTVEMADGTEHTFEINLNITDGG